MESRYDRQQRVTWWDQDLLSAARVVVAGAGALGNEVVKNLVLIGVGGIVIVDFDVVEASNLSRCVFLRPGDEGRPKAQVLAERAAEANPDVRVTAVTGDIRSFGAGLAWRADVIVGAVDNREARLHINRLAAKTRRSWVDGAIEGLQGVARVFSPPASCYECTLTEADWAALSERRSCRLLSRDDLQAGKVPTAATTASVVAGVQAQEVVKLLHAGRPEVRPHQGGLVFDGANNDAYPVTYPTIDDCLAHHHFDHPFPIGNAGSSTTLASLAAQVWPAGRPDELAVDLGDDHVLAWLCTSCGTRAPAGVPLALVDAGGAICGDCGQGRRPEIRASITASEPEASMTLAEIGVRPDEALAVRRGPEERYVWLRERDRRLPDGW